MNKLTIALVAFAVTCCFRSYSQNNDDMKAMMAAATPGETHKMLAKSAGTWTATVTMWMQPGTPPTTSTAEATNEMVLGGRYLKSVNKGNMMGQPFEGVGYTGYDNVKKQFVNSWVDNFGTGIMTMSGSWDAASKSIVYTGSMADPVSGKDTPFKEVWKFTDDDHQVMEMYYPVQGKEFKSMEIKYTRK
ncbi:MAG TPA: DUF1579 domain-containing protein [Puia sp.]|jgi:hypothetical protein|nr:DUF1579 domain-containing protein [Puia sp.]